MGNSHSANAGRERNDDECAEGVAASGEANGEPENCEIKCHKSDEFTPPDGNGATVVTDTDNGEHDRDSAADDAARPTDEPEVVLAADRGDNDAGYCDKLAAFRAELRRKRDVRQARLAAVQEEMERVRQALTEERAKNRALIRHIQQQQEEELRRLPQTAAGPLTRAPDAPDGHRREEDEAAEAQQQQSDTIGTIDTTTINASSGSITTTTTTAADADATRLALKKELAESQYELQKTTGETLALRSDLDQLRAQLHALQDQALVENAQQGQANRALKAELAESQFQLQIAQAEVLSLQTDIGQLRNQVKSLKDVVKAGKEIITIREDQVNQLKGKLRQIEDALQERELQIMSDDLRREYDRQLTNIRNLRDLYEERERVSRMERDNLLRQLDLKKSELATEQEKSQNLESLMEGLQGDLAAVRDELEQTKEKLCNSQAESKQLQTEMNVVNQFISKFLLGMSHKQTASAVNIDKLAEVLEENRALLIDMTKDEAETIDLGSFLPRALYDLVAEVDEIDHPAPPEGGEEAEDEADSSEEQFTNVQKASPEQIADKLPKVWRVLIELVNHQERAMQVPFVENGESEECLKLVQTLNGPKTVVSVSKTYIKLKDLILEKKSLKKETNRLKTLNVHLERRLETQEKRLSAVSLELTKTWHLVGKMQRQHRQLHTQEQILRYHLQQKRRLLSELKEELEYCRLKWSAARQKNIESEDQWKSLKADFASRRKQDSLNNSGESGYSDEQPSDEEEEGGSFPGKQKVHRGVSASEELLNTIVNFVPYRSASMTNIYSAQALLRKVQSESNMKSLSNVERANQFCNEKVEELPAFVDEEDMLPVSSVAVTAKKQRKSSAKKAKKKAKKNGPETAQDMFLRLLKMGADEPESNAAAGNDEDDEGSETDSSESSECLELAEIEQRVDSPTEQQESSVEPEQTSEELFRQKREARLQRMAELNSRLDRYSIPAKDAERQETPDQSQAGPSTEAPRSSEEDYQRRRARLERLEREAKELCSTLSKKVNRGSEIAAQIDEIHSGFMARQTESPAPGCSQRLEPEVSIKELRIPAPDEDLSCLTDKEREYTTSRADRLQKLESHGQDLLEQMNQTMKRGSKLTTRLDMLHSRYGQPRNSKALEDEGTPPEAPQEQEASAEAASELVEAEAVVVVEPLGPYAPVGPVELVLVSDEELMEEVDQLLDISNQRAPSEEEPPQ